MSNRIMFLFQGVSPIQHIIMKACEVLPFSAHTKCPNIQQLFRVHIFHQSCEKNNHKIICDRYLRPTFHHPHLNCLYLFHCPGLCSFFARLIYYFVFVCIPDKILRKEKKMSNILIICILVSGGYETIFGILRLSTMGLYQQLKLVNNN